VEERREKRYNWDDGKWLDLVFMAILEEEWTRTYKEKRCISNKSPS
jgi:RimJ/RimL family protein N-acetyltransferase